MTVERYSADVDSTLSSEDRHDRFSGSLWLPSTENKDTSGVLSANYPRKYSQQHAEAAQNSLAASCGKLLRMVMSRKLIDVAFDTKRSLVRIQLPTAHEFCLVDDGISSQLRGAALLFYNTSKESKGSCPSHK